MYLVLIYVPFHQDVDHLLRGISQQGSSRALVSTWSRQHLEEVKVQPRHSGNSDCKVWACRYETLFSCFSDLIN